MSQYRLHAFSDDALGTDDATALAERLRKGHITTKDVTEAAIARLQRVTPVINGLALETFIDARDRANEGGFNGFFSGVPSLIKDNIDLAGLPTGHGSAAVGAKPMKKTSVLAKQYLAQGFKIGRASCRERV